MRIFLLLFSFLVLTLAQAQQYPFYDFYELEEDPQQIEREATDQIYYYNKYLLTIEYEWNSLYNSYIKYKTLHYRVKLNTDAAIEEFNKVYIAMEEVFKILKLEARVIKKDEVLDVDVEVEKMLSENVEDQYFYFPITGIELGDELEIYYTLMMEPMFNGDQFYFQGEVPIYDFDFRFIVPNDTYFNFLAHNGLPEMVLVDTIIQRHQWDTHLDTIPAFKTEYFSEYSNSIMKLDASLKGTTNSYTDYSPYQVFVDYANEVYNKRLSPKTVKDLRKLNERLGVSRRNSQKENVRRIENYMKNEFLIGYGVAGMSIREMIYQGKGDGTGAIKLFLALFTQANIPFEYGLISDRYDTHFSAGIESDYFLQNYFIYLNEIDTYIAPIDFSARLGYLDYQWVPNNALYVKSSPYPKLESEYEVKSVKGTEASDNTDSTVIIINANEDLTSAEIRIERYITGYDAGEHQTIYYLYTDAKKKKVQEDLLNVFKDNSSYKMTSIEGVDPEDAFYKPLIIKGKVTTLFVPIFEKADKKTIFRLGEIFGEYINPLDLEKKKSDFIIGHPFTRVHTVIVNFPKTVKISNTEAVPVFEDLVELEDVFMSSEITVSDKQIIYKQKDIYKSHRFPLSAKEDLMKGFRFHSDLSKINLIVE